MLNGGMRHQKELDNIHDPMLSPSKKVFGLGGKIRLPDIVVGTA